MLTSSAMTVLSVMHCEPLLVKGKVKGNILFIFIQVFDCHPRQHKYSGAPANTRETKSPDWQSANQMLPQLVVIVS